MLFAKKDAPLKVEIPVAGDDRAITSKVGVIALVGFVVGVAWPRLLGVHVGPNPPGGSEDKVAAPALSGSASPHASASAAASASAEPSATAEDAPQVSNQEQVVVSSGSIAACKNKKGDKQKECGALSIDKMALPKLAGLKDCTSALGLDGEVTLGLTLDFDKSTVDVSEDKKSGLPTSTVRGILKCALDELKGMELDKVPHTHNRYLVDYTVKFYRPGSAPDEKDGAAPEGSADAKGDDNAANGADDLGRATVAWEKALVREGLKDDHVDKNGKVIARLAQGARVKLLKHEDEWYEISSGSTKGWVYRSAIGK